MADRKRDVTLVLGWDYGATVDRTAVTLALQRGVLARGGVASGYVLSADVRRQLLKDLRESERKLFGSVSRHD